MHYPTAIQYGSAFNVFEEIFFKNVICVMMFFNNQKINVYPINDSSLRALLQNVFIIIITIII